MIIPIVILTLGVVTTFIVTVYLIIQIIIKKVSKETIEKKLIVKTFAFGALWAVLGSLNAVAVISAIAMEDQLVISILKRGADLTAKSLVYTVQSIETNWNDETLKKISKIDVTLEKVTHKKKGDYTIYKFFLKLNNRSNKDEFLSYYILKSNNLLFISDTEDISYPLHYKTTEYRSSIPLGKSRITVYTKLKSSINLQQLHFGKKKIPLLPAIH